MTEPDDTEITYRDATVTCHTDGCGNAGHAIDTPIADEPEPRVICGACGQPITDIKGVTPSE